MSAPAPTTALSAPPPDDALPPTTTTNHLPLLHSDELESEKPSHASSLAGQKDGTDFDNTAVTTTNPTPKSPGLFSKRWALGPVVKDYGDYGLLACSFVTGMVDGASFLNWGVFVGMQTGEFSCYSFSCSWDDEVESIRVELVRFDLINSSIRSSIEDWLVAGRVADGYWHVLNARHDASNLITRLQPIYSNYHVPRQHSNINPQATP
jgi:hypothetical protein